MKLKGKFKKPTIKRNKTPKTHKVSQNRKLSFSKNKIQKIVSLSIIGLILLSLLFNVIYFTKYQAIRNSTKSTEQRIDKKLAELEKGNEGKADTINYFVKQFLKDYMYIPDSEDKRNEHLNDLKKYFYNGFDVEKIYDFEGFNGSQKLDNAEYIKTEFQNKENALVYYNIEYTTTTTEKVETKKKEKGKEKTEVSTKDKDISKEGQIAVPVKVKNGGYAVVDNPKLIYTKMFSNVTKEDIDKDLERNNTMYSDDEDVNKSISDFFKAYGKSDDTLNLLSNYAVGLTNQELIDYQIVNAYMDKESNKIITKVNVKYKDEETSLNNLYTYNVELTKNNNKYYIEKIY